MVTFASDLSKTCSVHFMFRPLNIFAIIFTTINDYSPLILIIMRKLFLAFPYPCTSKLLLYYYILK